MAGHQRSKALRGRMVEAIGDATQSEREDIWTNLPGKVVSVSADGRTATIKPLYRPRFNGEPVDMPELVEVPINWPRGGRMVMRFPLKEGDQGMISVMSRNMDDWYAKDGEQPAATQRMHDLSDATFSPGLSSSQAPVGPYDPDNFELSSADGQYRISMSPEGKFKIDGAEGNLYTILAEFMELVASDELLIKHGSSAGSGHQLFNRVALMALAQKVRDMAL